MSYSRNYTGYVRGSTTVSYPASESGGTKTVDYEEPVYITIDVDTTAFDLSVADCNGSVDGLTGAVVATEAAQVEAKREASKQIASSIVKGFFQYVGADLSQKIKELSSRCESLFFALMGHKDNCLAKTKQMQDDYNRISKRYSKIFEDLDKETISRIEVLDKPTFQFADTAQSLIDRSSDTDLLGISTISANENIKLETVLSCSHVKQQASILLSKANEYLQGTYRLSNAVRDMLYESRDGEDILLPVLFVESVVNADNRETRILGTDAEYMPSGQKVNSQLRSRFLSQDIEWSAMEDRDFEKVLSYVNAQVQTGQMDERTLKTMLGLMNSQVIQTIKA